MPEPPPIDLWLTMGSTYTYLTVMRLGAVEASTGVRFRLCIWPVLGERLSDDRSQRSLMIEAIARAMMGLTEAKSAEKTMPSSPTTSF